MQLARRVVLILLAVAFAQVVHAQGLAGAAQKEKERRAKLKAADPAKSYGQDDLGRAGAPLANDPSIPPAAGQQSPAHDTMGSSGPSGSTGAGSESYWRSRSRQLRSAVEAAEAAVKLAESMPGATGPTPLGDYKVPCQPGRLVMPDGSLGPMTNNCSGGIARDQSRAAQSRLEAARQALERARQALANFEEQARRAGALPGWLR